MAGRPLSEAIVTGWFVMVEVGGEVARLQYGVKKIKIIAAQAVRPKAPKR